jgi:hypothetical protein
MAQYLLIEVTKKSGWGKKVRIPRQIDLAFQEEECMGIGF